MGSSYHAGNESVQFDSRNYTEIRVQQVFLFVIRILHIADLHLGYSGPAHLLVQGEDGDAGRPVREVDIERACEWIVHQASALKPAVDLVLIAGDLFHRANPTPKAVSAAARLVADLRRGGADVVVIDGNHDAIVRTTHGSPLAFLEALGAFVVTGCGRMLDEHDWQRQTLKDLVVHAFPSSAPIIDQDLLIPVPGRINILLAHGRYGGMTDVTNMRSATLLPSEFLCRGWDYAALGDWHGHQFQPLKEVPAVYVGSLQAMNFGEARDHPARHDDPYARGGMLLIDAVFGSPISLQSLPFLNRRPVIRLAPIDAANLSAQKALEILESRLEDLPESSLACIRLTNCDSTFFSEINRVQLNELKLRCLNLEVILEETEAEALQSTSPPNNAALHEQWADYLANHAIPTELEWLRERGGELLSQALKNQSERVTSDLGDT
jgi:DNA repair exonuclease SbcCD nuclease subunit